MRSHLKLKRLSPRRWAVMEYGRVVFTTHKGRKGAARALAFYRNLERKHCHGA